MDAILVVNAGSSSVKFQIFDYSASIVSHHLIKGQVDGIGSKPRLRAATRDGASLVDKTYEPGKIANVPSAIAEAGAWLRSNQDFTLTAVGHRVVHGGPDYDRPIIVNRDILTRLEKYCPLAPLHQPNNLAPIRTLMERSPELTQVACFDTAFHRTHSPLADRYAIPEHFYREGLSYEYVAGRLREIAPDIASKRVIIAHLGSGASMCALFEGKSVESTMGFTALDGLPMGTRPGQIDPGVLLYLIAEKGMSAPELESLLYRDCGLKGMSGISNDLRELQASKEPSATLAIDYFVYRIVLNAGMLTAALGGLDAFVFTAGIGENSATIRSRVTEKLACLGATLDNHANQKAETLISLADSKVTVHIVPTDEELMIARHTQRLIRK
jgi:acetate kinase